MSAGKLFQITGVEYDRLASAFASTLAACDQMIDSLYMSQLLLYFLSNQHTERKAIMATLAAIIDQLRNVVLVVFTDILSSFISGCCGGLDGCRSVEWLLLLRITEHKFVYTNLHACTSRRPTGSTPYDRIATRRAVSLRRHVSSVLCEAQTRWSHDL